MPTPRAKQIKKTKTIPRSGRGQAQEFICATTRAFIEDSAPQKNAGKQLSTKFFCGTGFYKRQEKKIQREEKR